MREGDPEYFTSVEVARLFRVDRATVAKWARYWHATGEVHVTRTPGRIGVGDWRFLAADIRALLAAGHDHLAGQPRER